MTFTDFVTSYRYDALNRLVRTDLAFGPGTPAAFEHRAYDFNGNLTSISLPDPSPDPAQVLPTNRTVLQYFDPGWVATSQDPGGPRLHFDYNARGQQIRRTPEDANGNLDSARHVDWAYYLDGLLQLRTDQQEQPVSYTYDADNLLVSAHDASGLTTPSQTFVDTRNAYDDLDRMVRSDLRRPQQESDWTFSRFGYDANGNVTEQETNGKEGNGADNLPNGVVVKAGRTQLATYDQVDWLSVQTDFGTDPGAQDDQRTTNRYTPLGLQSSRLIEGSNGSGGWATKQLTTWEYFANGKLRHLKTTNASNATLEEHAVDYLDDQGVYVNGNRTKDTFTLTPGNGASGPCASSTCTAKYTYDARDRLTVADDGHGTTTTYTLDGVGNIVTEARGSVIRNYSYVGNQLQRIASGGEAQRYWYDTFGRLACVTTDVGSADDCAPGGTTGAAITLLQDYRYDYLDRLVLSRTFASGNQTDRAEYTYDALNRLSTEDELHPGFDGRTRTTELSYIGQSNLASGEKQSDSTGTLAVKDYSYDATGRRLSLTNTQFTGGTPQTSTYTYGYDAHGSVSQLVDAAGNTRASYGYQPYGQTDTGLTQGDTDPVNPLNPYRYGGMRLDSGSNTVDMGARRFGPDISRFLSQDFFYGALANLSLSTDPLTQNRYAFAGGNPLGYREWTGHQFLTDGGGGASPPSATTTQPATGGKNDSPDSYAERRRRHEKGTEDYYIDEISSTMEVTEYQKTRVKTGEYKFSLINCEFFEGGCAFARVDLTVPIWEDKVVPVTTKQTWVTGIATNRLNGETFRYEGISVEPTAEPGVTQSHRLGWLDQDNPPSAKEVSDSLGGYSASLSLSVGPLTGSRTVSLPSGETATERGEVWSVVPPRNPFKFEVSVSAGLSYAWPGGKYAWPGRTHVPQIFTPPARSGAGGGEGGLFTP